MSKTHMRERARQVLAEVAARNGRLHVDDWRALGVRYGYEVRGLAGFFGGRWPSMWSEGDWRVLTTLGEERAA